MLKANGVIAFVTHRAIKVINRLTIQRFPHQTRGASDRVIGNEIRAAFDNAAYCNGNGACFDFDETSPMCPSYKATRDRRFSPRAEPC